MARLLSRRVTQVLLTILALFLVGTVIFLSAVNAYFSIDKSTIILPEELGTWEEIELGAQDTSLSWKARYPWIAEALSLKPNRTTTLTKDQELKFDDAIAKHAAEAAKAAGFSDDDASFIPPGRDNTPKKWNAATDPPEKVPRIIHQTWKDKTLPPNWQAVRDECAKMHPD
jgi:mannosyltransferase OCH1-like enzyme